MGEAGWIEASLRPDPGWVSAPWAERVLDWRLGRGGVLPSGAVAWESVGGGVRLFEVRGGVGAAAFMAVGVEVGGARAAIAVTDRKVPDGELRTGAVLGRLVTGLWGGLPVGLDGLEDVDADDAAEFPAWSLRAQEHAHRCAPVLHAALVNPRAWLAGVPADWSPRLQAVTLTRFASVGATGVGEALTWLEAGLAPQQVLRWRLFGWEDDTQIRAWFRHVDDEEFAAAYRDAGLDPVVARLWRERAPEVHPVTAAALAEARPPWSAAAFARLQAAVQAHYPDVVFADPLGAHTFARGSGDALLVTWARLPWATPRLVLLCVAAGLTPREASALHGRGALSEVGLRAMIALRA